MNPFPLWPFVPVLMEPLVWLAVLAAARPSRDRMLGFYALILVVFGTAITGYFTGAFGYVPWTIAVSYLLVAAIAWFPRKTERTAVVAGVGGGATLALAAALMITSEMKGVVDRTLVCENCVPELKAVNGQKLKLRYEGLVGTFTNQGYAAAHEQANVNHEEVLQRLIAKSGQPFPARVALIYTYGKLSGARLVGADGITFKNFYYGAERLEQEFIQTLGDH